MSVCLNRQVRCVNRKRVHRPMRLTGLEALYPKPKFTKRNDRRGAFPCLLKGPRIERPNQA